MRSTANPVQESADAVVTAVVSATVVGARVVVVVVVVGLYHQLTAGQVPLLVNVDGASSRTKLMQRAMQKYCWYLTTSQLILLVQVTAKGLIYVTLRVFKDAQDQILLSYLEFGHFLVGVGIRDPS